MTMIQGGAVIVGYDGSDFSVQALDWAMDEAELGKAPLTIVHTWQWPYADVGAEAKDHLRRAAQHVLWHGAECVRASSSITEVQSDLYEGPAGPRLVGLSRQARLVVVGSRGMSPISSAVVGSVARHVAEHAYCPVIVVRGPGPLPVPAPTAPVLAAVAYHGQEAILEFAFREAAMRHLPLVVLRALTLPHSFVGKGPLPDANDESRELSHQVTRVGARHPEVHAEVQLIAGPPQEALGHIWKGAALLVTGRRRQGWLGPTGRFVIKDAPCPVAIVPCPGHLE